MRPTSGMTPERAAIFELLKFHFPDMDEKDLVEWSGGIDSGGYLLEDVLSNLGTRPVPMAPNENDGLRWNDPDYVVPTDFARAIESSEEWFQRVTDWKMSEDDQDTLLAYMHDKFVNGFGPDENNPSAWEPGMSMEVFMGEEDGPSIPSIIYDSQQSWYDDMAYKPLEGGLPEGWLTFWGDDYRDSDNKPVISDWLDDWVERFNQNNERPAPFDEKLLIDDFYNHAVDGLYAQDWWVEKTNNFLSMTEMWYTQGGPGGADGSGYVMPGEQGADWAAYAGTGNWGKIWSDSIEIIKSTAEDLGIEDELTDTMVSQIAFTLMKEGGAAAHLEPQTAQGWPNQARQLVENILVDNIRSGSFQKDLGVGSIQDIEKRLLAYADMQMIDLNAFAAMNETSVRDMALDIKSEQGDNENQVMSKIANQAYKQWGLTQDEIDGMGQPGGENSSTMTNHIGHLWEGATTVWGDNSYRKNDPWLMENYQVLDEDGSKRFRTKEEMKAAARQNMDRFQNSTEFQNPMNQFIQGATSMFRSDY